MIPALCFGVMIDYLQLVVDKLLIADFLLRRKRCGGQDG